MQCQGNVHIVSLRMRARDGMVTVMIIIDLIQNWNSASTYLLESTFYIQRAKWRTTVSLISRDVCHGEVEVRFIHPASVSDLSACRHST